GTAERAVCGCLGSNRLPPLWALVVGQLTFAGTRLEGGQSFASAARRDDMLLVAVTAVELRDDSAADPEHDASYHLSPGESAWIPAGRHRFQNTSDAATRFVTIE